MNRMFRTIRTIRLRRLSSRRLAFVFALFAVGVVCAFAAIPQQADAAVALNYTAFGDSLAFGAFAPIGHGYVPLYEHYIEGATGSSVSLLNLGIPGWTSGNLRSATSGGALFRLSIYFSRILTWNIGGNDLSAARDSYKAGTCGGADNQNCLRAAVATFQTNWNGILTDLFTLRHGRATLMRTMTVYNPFVSEDMGSDSWSADGGLTDFQALKPYLDAVNNHIKFTSALVGVKVAPVYEAFNGVGGNEDPVSKGLIAFDGFHPNGNGHALIASLLGGLGYASIVP